MSKDNINTLNGEDKVALLLSGLDSQAALGVIQQFSAEHKNRIQGLMQQRAGGSAPSELLDRLMRELAATIARPAKADPALRLVTPDGAERNPTSRRSPGVTDHPQTSDRDAVHDEANINDPISQLRAMDLDRLLAGLEGEHPQTVATVINCLEPQAAGDVLKRLAADTRKLAFLRFGQTSHSPLDLVPRIVQAIVQKCHALSQSPLEEKGDAKYQKMADVLKRLDRTDRTELLAALTEQDSATAALVKDRLYVFEDLRLIEDRSVQKLLAEIDSKMLATALKGAAEDISQKVLNNLSKRGREMVTEEINFMGSIPPAQIQQAQKAVVEVIQRLDQAGELVMVQG
jgi:flagellar motor switch protein FliG